MKTEQVSLVLKHQIVLVAKDCLVSLEELKVYVLQIQIVKHTIYAQHSQTELILAIH